MKKTQICICHFQHVSLDLCFTHTLGDIWSIGTTVVIGQISIESPLSTNQQSFYRHGSDSYPGNLNQTVFHIVIWGLNRPKKKIFYFMLK